jgi:hypothetical protein
VHFWYYHHQSWQIYISIFTRIRSWSDITERKSLPNMRLKRTSYLTRDETLSVLLMKITLCLLLMSIINNNRFHIIFQCSHLLRVCLCTRYTRTSYTTLFSLTICNVLFSCITERELCCWFLVRNYVQLYKKCIEAFSAPISKSQHSENAITVTSCLNSPHKQTKTIPITV